ncbi:Heat shock factor (HSF)-type, DNA-binding domain and Winged helix-turn-helix DNA-binding domain-containing protein [Strongyloides ratti]|uniref:Heat shock factor (HSF)-type, DNA-binding domain and Winged helix-turn-helix DNA-binding domain-containing protein n=1 Tax=Strongyloides ratti TaxID=34506 RepID=A0A090KWZ6_STRRB|nr:Heat shock factor (HSF)-type, DNA-binding domain and Winged helix-turn-helix DNA-binding domain-containing protein [Strongyloides ratti]CEF62030.1 Heat shock factor (HSF)-type, DNA-binding domain and Winged helix-turn-helix DNA-binding domain-containing protein [Strongyloides ratti]
MNIFEVLKTERPIESSGTETGKIPTFILKLWQIVNDTEYNRIIGWSENGSSFLVKEPYIMYKKILPLYFKHSNLNSFIRQLNMYGFKKIIDIEKTGNLNFNSMNISEFSHKFFLRGRVDLLNNIKRKISSQKVVHENYINFENNHINSENIKLLNEIKNMKSKQSDTENFINQLVLQNETLKKEITILHTTYKMQQNVVKKLCDIIGKFGNQQSKSMIVIPSPIFSTTKNNTGSPSYNNQVNYSSQNTKSNYVDLDYINIAISSSDTTP